VFPAERGNVGEQLVGQGFGLGTKLGNGVAEVDGVPEDDGGDREVEAGGTVALVFEGAVPDLAVTMEMFQPRMLVTMGVRLAGRSAHNRRLRPKTHRRWR
jgi:hypothetical protein